MDWIVKLLSNIILRTHSKNGFKKEQLGGKEIEIDFNKFFSDFNKSKEIYNELIRKCHPDRFVDPDLNSIATDLSFKNSRKQIKL